MGFQQLLLSMMRKSVKSLQNMLNELSVELNTEPMSASAYSQARQQLSHTAFIELNREIIVSAYMSEAPKRYKGMRVLAGDGTRIRLPEHPSIRKEFGGIATCTGEDDTVVGDYLCSQGYVLHDVLNKVAIDAQMGRSDAYEVDQAIQSLDYTEADDLLLYDRNFASYRFLATLTKRQRNFVIRCSSGSFGAAQRLFAADQETSEVVTLSAPTGKKRAIEQEGLPLSITLRFVTVRLSTGELEILATSLLDEETFPTPDFKEIYNLRWGVETLYDLLKNRLSLENFSGKTAEAIRQDFHAAIFISGLESLLTQEADDLLLERSQHNKLGQTVNNMVSFHAIKLQVFRLLYSDDDPQTLLDNLTQLFLMNPTYTNRNRDVPRRKSSPTKSLSYHKRLRKHCF